MRSRQTRTCSTLPRRPSAPRRAASRRRDRPRPLAARMASPTPPAAEAAATVARTAAWVETPVSCRTRQEAEHGREEERAVGARPRRAPALRSSRRRRPHRCRRRIDPARHGSAPRERCSWRSGAGQRRSRGSVAPARDRDLPRAERPRPRRLPRPRRRRGRSRPPASPPATRRPRRRGSRRGSSGRPGRRPRSSRLPTTPNRETATRIRPSDSEARRRGANQRACARGFAAPALPARATSALLETVPSDDHVPTPWDVEDVRSIPSGSSASSAPPFADSRMRFFARGRAFAIDATPARRDDEIYSPPTENIPWPASTR